MQTVLVQVQMWNDCEQAAGSLDLVSESCAEYEHVQKKFNMFEYSV